MRDCFFGLFAARHWQNAERRPFISRWKWFLCASFASGPSTVSNVPHHHHEPASRTRISDSYAERPLPPIHLWRHADGIWHWKGRNDLGPVIEMCSPEASTNPETSNALPTYEPLPATREGLCGISAPILLKSLGGETKAAINPPAIVDCPMAAALLRSAGLQAVCKISSPAVVWKMAQERT